MRLSSLLEQAIKQDIKEGYCPDDCECDEDEECDIEDYLEIKKMDKVDRDYDEKMDRELED